MANEAGDRDYTAWRSDCRGVSVQFAANDARVVTKGDGGVPVAKQTVETKAGK